jgi:hypothetical protein
MFEKFVGAAIVITLLTCGCGGNSSSDSGSATLRVLNASADVESVNVIVGGQTVATNVEYPMCIYEICQTLSGYATVKSGGISFALEDSTGKNYVPSQFQKLSLTNNTQNTFVLSPPTSGNVNDSDAGYLFVDDDTPVANSVQIRIANVDPRNPTVSVYILPNGVTPSGNPSISSLTIGTASSYMTLPPGSYTVWFVGNFGVLGPQQYLSWGPTTYSANQNYTVYLMQQIDSDRAVILADN